VEQKSVTMLVCHTFTVIHTQTHTHTQSPRKVLHCKNKSRNWSKRAHKLHDTILRFFTNKFRGQTSTDKKRGREWECEGLYYLQYSYYHSPNAI